MKVLLSLLGFCLPFLVFSQPESQLDTLTIQSTRLPLRWEETGRNISVISSEKIRKLPANSVEEVLRYIPGLEVQNRGAFGVQGDILLRGSTFSQVLVLIDGLRFNDPLTGHFNSYLPVSLSEIERIEVLRGPAAALYGPDAVGGVVHILTKSFVETHTPKGLDAEAQAGAGQYGLFTGRGGAYYQDKTWSAGAGATLNRSSGQELPSGLSSDFLIYNLSGSAGWRPSDRWRLAVRSAYDHRNFNAQYFYTQSPFDQSREQTTSWWNQVHAARKGKNGQTLLNVGFKVTRDSFLFNPAFTANIHRTRFFNAQLHHSFFVRKKSQLALGFQGDWRDIESNDRGDHADGHAGLYLMGAFRPVHGLAITASLRGDLDANYGFEVLPQLNASYRLGRLLLRGSTGRSIRAADYTERYISTQLPGPLAPGRNLGNPNLSAERAWSHEIGADFFPIQGLRISGTTFLRRGKDLIDYVITPAGDIPNNGNLTPGASYFYTRNLAQVHSQGFEAEIWYDHDFSEHTALQTSLGYTWLDSRNPQDPDQVSKYLSNHARQLFTCSALLQVHVFSFSLQGLWKQRQEESAQDIQAALTRSYTVWHGQVGYSFLKSKLKVFVQVHNLLNVQYADILGAKMPNRWVMAGLGGDL